MRSVRVVVAALPIMLAAVCAAAASADPAFGVTGTAIHPRSELGGSMSSIAIQPDGKPVVAGGYRIRTTNRNGIGTQAFVSRLRTDGAVDTSLAGGIILRDPPVKVLVQRDGKIVVGGSPVLARYHVDGAIDAQYTEAAAASVASMADGFAFRDFALQADGKVVVAGTVSQGPSGPAVELVRFDADGSRDASFGPAGPVRFPVLASFQSLAAVISLPGEKTGLAITTFTEGSVTASVYRVNADGTVDTSFDVDGSASKTNEIARGLATQADGRMLLVTVAGAPGSRTMRITRFNERGGIDATFGAAGVVTQPIGDDDGAHPLAVRPDGRIVVATAPPLRVIGFDKRGMLDAAFGDAGVFVPASLRSVEAIAFGSDGALWLAGASTEAASTSAGRHGNPAIVRRSGGTKPTPSAKARRSTTTSPATVRASPPRPVPVH